MVQSPIEKATVRQARDDDRPTEYDIAKAKLGPQGVPGEPDKPPIAERCKRLFMNRDFPRELSGL